MSRKNTLTPIKIMDAVDLTSNQTSTPVKITFLDNVSIQINLTDSPAGSFSVEVSNDFSLNPDGSIRDAGQWTVLTSPSSVTVTAGSPDPIFIDVNQSGANAIRLVWTDNASPDGTATCYLMAKAV